MHRIPLEHLLDLPNEFWVCTVLRAAGIQDAAAVQQMGPDANMEYRGTPFFGGKAMTAVPLLVHEGPGGPARNGAIADRKTRPEQHQTEDPSAYKQQKDRSAPASPPTGLHSHLASNNGSDASCRVTRYAYFQVKVVKQILRRGGARVDAIRVHCATKIIRL